MAGQVLDEDGKPIAGPIITLFTDVKYPEWIGASIQTISDVREDGAFSFDRLIAGVEYYVEIRADGHAGRLRADMRLNEVRLPATNQELRGTVVNPRGQRVEGATVSFQRETGRQLVPPGSATWFQNTNAQGEFHLTGLPKGLLTVTTFRNPGKADVQINNLVRDKFQSGRGDVRIVLPDINERLRGIE
jgi:hypothetical protein